MKDKTSLYQRPEIVEIGDAEILTLGITGRRRDCCHGRRYPDSGGGGGNPILL